MSHTEKSKMYLKICKLIRELKLMSYSALGEPIYESINNSVIQLEAAKDILKTEIENI